MDYSEFRRLVNVSKEDFCRETFADNRQMIRIKKEKTVVRNLTRIFDATLEISNEKGFQAMTMRDLSHLWQSIDDFYRATRLRDDLIGLRNIAQAAWVITLAAWHNRHSRGAHYRVDSQSGGEVGIHDAEHDSGPVIDPPGL